MRFEPNMETLNRLVNYVNKVSNNLDHLAMEQINDILELRDQLIVELENTIGLTGEQKTQLQTLATYDQKIVERMEQLKQEAANELIKISNIRKQQEGYSSQYDTESYFIDNKK